MKEYKFTVSYDWNPYDVVAELNNITSKYGITMDFDNEEHDGFDICIVKIEDRLDPSYSPPGAFKNH